MNELVRGLGDSPVAKALLSHVQFSQEFCDNNALPPCPAVMHEAEP